MEAASIAVMTPDWLILHAGALGDLVLTVQTLLRIGDFGAAARIQLLSRADLGDLSDWTPSITRQSLDGLAAHWLYSDGDEPPPADLRGLIVGRRVLNALGGADTVVHRRLAILQPTRLLSFDPRPHSDWREHITEQWLRELKPQLKAADSVAGCSHLLHTKHRLIAGATPPSPPRCVLIHPGSGGRAKCWPLDNFRALARDVCNGGHAVRFIIGPVELERWPETDFEGMGQDFPLLICEDADTLVQAVSAAGLFVSNDSGTAHLAALVGTPTLTIFGPTSPVVWRPLGQESEIVAGDPERDAVDWGITARHVADRIREMLPL